MSRVAEAPPTEITRKKSRRTLWLVLIFFLLPVIGLAAYTWLTLHYSYSSGERSGYIQKISKKGWLCKTWEGELAMTTVPGTAPQLFYFTVQNDATAERIEQLAGQRVALMYQQHKGVPSSCFGDTEYFVTAVRSIGQ
jgi:hypothetical protein